MTTISRYRVMVGIGSLTLVILFLVLPSTESPSFAQGASCTLDASTPNIYPGYPNPPYQYAEISVGFVTQCSAPVGASVCFQEVYPFATTPPFWNDLDCSYGNPSPDAGWGANIGNNCVFDSNTHYYQTVVRTNAGQQKASGSVGVNLACYY